MVGIRLSAEKRQKIEAWASLQADKPSLSEAIRRLLDQALSRRRAKTDLK
jgi:hypothetical protein